MIKQIIQIVAFVGVIAIAATYAITITTQRGQNSLADSSQTDTSYESDSKKEEIFKNSNYLHKKNSTHEISEKIGMLDSIAQTIEKNIIKAFNNLDGYLDKYLDVSVLEFF